MLIENLQNNLLNYNVSVNEANWDKLGWWDKWGKQSAIGLGTGTAAIGAAYGLKSMLSDDDE